MRPNDSERDRPTPSSYDPPRVTVIGTVRELTQGNPSAGVVDAAVFSSDRRLKDSVRPVDPRAVLRTLAGL